MKRTPFLLFLLFLWPLSLGFAQTDLHIFIEGGSAIEGHRDFFMNNFKMEAISLAVTVTETRNESNFTIRFRTEGTDDPDFPFVILMTLLDNRDDREIVSFDWPFSSLEEMYSYNQFVLYQAVALIPKDDLGTESDGASGGGEERIVEVPTEVDKRWQYKRLYVRASLDYPVAFYQLQPTGLYQGEGLWDGATNSPLVEDIDNITMPQPGLTIGVEWPFLSFLSAEVQMMATLGDPTGYTFVNAIAGAQLKGIFRTETFMLQPYGAFQMHMPFTISPEFAQFPPFFAGGGMQVNVKGFTDGAFFLDVNFMLNLGDVLMHNRYLATPWPETIHYQHFVFTIGIGYKFGFLGERKPPVKKEVAESATP